MNLYVVEQQEVTPGVKHEAMPVVRRALVTGASAKDAHSRFLSEYDVRLGEKHRLWVRRAS